MTREEWLLTAAQKISEEVLTPLEAKVPPYCISVGFPKGRHGRTKAVGQCWSPTLAKDQRAHIFVTPERDGAEAPAIIGTILHELLHAVAGTKCGHRGEFARLAKAVGLLKPLTCTNPSEVLVARLNAISAAVGPFPHGALQPLEKVKKGSRLRLWECACPVGTKGKKARVASDEWNVTCNNCSTLFEPVE